MRSRVRSAITTACVVLLFAATALAGDQPPADTGVLDVTLPPDATLTINGEDFGDQRHFEMKPLDPKWLYPYELVTRFRGGESVQRKVLLKGGWSVRVVLAPRKLSAPELMLQNGHSDGISAVQFSADGRYILTGSYDETAILWDAATGRQLRSFEGHTGSVLSGAFSPNGEHVLTGSFFSAVTLWDAAAGRQLRSLRGHSGPVVSVAFSPEGGQVLTAAWDMSAILWDASTGQGLRILTGHTGSVNSVALNTDGSQILTGSDDKRAILWDSTTGEQLRSFQGHNQKVTSVAVSPDVVRLRRTTRRDGLRGYNDARLGHRHG
jgi:WD40 repeat protein